MQRHAGNTQGEKNMYEDRRPDKDAIFPEDIPLEMVPPADIEKRSFELIESGMKHPDLPPELKPIVKRVIHTTADFDYEENLVFSPGVVPKAIALIRSGAGVVTDTNMAFSGIHKSTLRAFGGEAYCFMSDPDVAAEAKKTGQTRAAVCMERAAAMEGPLIFAVGNAPTALIRLYEFIRRGEYRPALIIGCPVGFVNAAQSKELILRTDADYIVTRGRKGGSNVAAAICNALLYMAAGTR